MSTDPENPHAGQGAVVLDIGGDVGAIVVSMPRDMIGEEVDIVPLDHDAVPGHDHDHAHDHAHGHDHGHGHGHSHDHDHGHGHVEHVAVVDRPNPDGSTSPSLVYGAVTAGRYRLRVRPNGPDGPEVEAIGGQVTFLDW